MSPTMAMVLAITTSTVLRIVLGRLHPLALLPLVLACAVLFDATRGTDWQWGYLAVGLFAAGLAVKRTFRPPLPPPPADAVE